MARQLEEIRIANFDVLAKNKISPPLVGEDEGEGDKLLVEIS
jgi:hypothetical protein